MVGTERGMFPRHQSDRHERDDGCVSQVRIDPLSGVVTVVAGDRQGRPDRPEGCPFCIGGLEAPEPYDVRSFPNRWPPLPDGRAEVLLFSPEHEASLGRPCCGSTSFRPTAGPGRRPTCTPTSHPCTAAPARSGSSPAASTAAACGSTPSSPRNAAATLRDLHGAGG